MIGSGVCHCGDEMDGHMSSNHSPVEMDPPEAHKCPECGWALWRQPSGVECSSPKCDWWFCL